MKKLMTGLLVVSSTLMATTAKAALQTYTPDLQLALGAPWDPLYPSENKMIYGCFTHNAKAFVPSGQDNFTEDYTEALKEVDSLIAMEAAAKAKARIMGIGAKIDASFSRRKTELEKARTVRWALVGSRTYNMETSGEILLTEKGQRILAQAVERKDSEYFATQCGRNLVTGITKKAEVAVLFEFTSSSSQQAEQIRAQLSAQASIGKLGAEHSGSFLSDIKKIDSGMTYKVSVYQNFARDKVEGPMAILSSDPGNLLALRRAMADTLTKIDYENAPVYSFNDQSVLNTLTADIQEDRARLIPNLQQSIAAHKVNLEKVSIRLGALDEILGSLDNGYFKLSNEAVAAIEAESDRLVKVQDSIEDAITTCQKATRLSGCPRPVPPRFANILSAMNLSFATFNGWSGASSAYYNAGPERYVISTTYYPSVSFRYASFINSAELYENGQLIRSLSADDVDRLASNTIALNSYISLSRTTEQYCWRGEWGNCNARAADRSYRVSWFRSGAAGITDRNYVLRVFDVEGNFYDINLRNPGSAPVLDPSTN
ncbi:hypothetical protein [Bdellovibrio sp. NC01]|uniref:hypothetical protein n=1 Tax=Bdellovibrio sp. NC01 TaxID=2220073 RepID=UPI0011594C7D|nr:hypothetical protein [Bdellovibrio sp. NC01]QDK38291.1 hypothetical protein DOE51_12235 [Bdellovibrio sp. NC01]